MELPNKKVTVVFQTLLHPQHISDDYIHLGDVKLQLEYILNAETGIVLC